MKCQCGCGQETSIATKTRSAKGHAKGQPVNYILGHNRRGQSLPVEDRVKHALFDEEHPNWKGDEVGYMALHQWVYARKERTGICQQCGAEGVTEFANVSGEYRRDVEDFIELCVPCHRRYDQ